MKTAIIGVLLSLGISISFADGMKLEDNAIAWQWHLDGGFWPAQLDDKINRARLNLSGECFQLVLGDGTVVKASDFKLDGSPEEERLRPEVDSPTLARHFPGRQLVVKLSAANRNLSAEWRVILRDGSTYIREELALRATGGNVLIKKIILLDEKVPGAETAGTVDGSPVVAGNFFFAYEEPMARNTVDPDHEVECSFDRNAVLRAGETLTQSCVIGVAPAGQMRRGFLGYLERERAHPYRPFLHYNSWYDIAWSTRKYTQTECLEVISQFGRELVEKRGVKMSSFLFDDGWDDNQTLWKFNSGFPDGFAPLETAAAKYHAGIGVWLSPFGGYSDAREQRLKYGLEHGYETNTYGFSLAGPKYFHRFRDICLQMVQTYGVNTFKFDGLAAGARAGENGLTRDGDAMMRLIADLRAAEPGIYINETTGTWPSPFWLLYVDSTWRGGADHDFQGRGSWCQQWMTYRDAETYHNVVECAPLYPLNSLMLHGIIYARHAVHLDSMSDADFTGQAREFFGSGTQLQEMYITPGLLDERNWSDLAEAAKWADANADVLVDTHWVGGDPAKGEIYGWASWSPGKATLVLRNPDDKAAAFTTDAKELFQLPPDARIRYVMHSPWKADREEATVELQAGLPHTFTLQPFEVLVLEEARTR